MVYFKVSPVEVSSASRCLETNQSYQMSSFEASPKNQNKMSCDDDTISTKSEEEQYFSLDNDVLRFDLKTTPAFILAFVACSFAMSALLKTFNINPKINKKPTNKKPTRPSFVPYDEMEDKQTQTEDKQTQTQTDEMPELIYDADDISISSNQYCEKCEKFGCCCPCDLCGHDGCICDTLYCNCGGTYDIRGFCPECDIGEGNFTIGYVPEKEHYGGKLEDLKKDETMEKLNELNNKIKDYKKGQSGKFYKDELAEMEEDEATFWELYAVKELEYIKDEESDDDMSITTAEKMTLEETDRIIQLGLLECYITPPNSPIVSWKNDYDLWEKDRVENEKMVGSIIDDVIDLATRKKTREEELNEARWKRTKRTLELNFQRRQRETTEKIVGSIIDDVIDLATRKKTQTIEEQRKEAQEKRRLDYERRQKEAEEKEAEEKRQSDIEASLQEALRIQEEEAQEAQAQEEAQIAEHQTQLEAITQLEAEVARLAEINERNIQTRERRHRPNCECETCRRELEQAIQEGRARTALRDERNRQARDAEIARQEAQAQEEAQIAEHQARLEQEAEIAYDMNAAQEAQIAEPKRLEHEIATTRGTKHNRGVPTTEQGETPTQDARQ
jgi:hypothetical protein